MEFLMIPRMAANISKCKSEHLVWAYAKA